MAATRTATVTWNGNLATGSGTVTAGSSELFTDLPVSWSARTEAPQGQTSPEELLAAAHASCFSMALSGALDRAGTPPEHLHVSATVTFEKVEDAWTVTRSQLDVLGVVPGHRRRRLRCGRPGHRGWLPDLTCPGRQRRAVRLRGARG